MSKFNDIDFIRYLIIIGSATGPLSSGSLPNLLSILSGLQRSHGQGNKEGFASEQIFPNLQRGDWKESVE